VDKESGSLSSVFSGILYPFFPNQQITFDLDAGVTENYKLFEGVVVK